MSEVYVMIYDIFGSLFVWYSI